MTTLFPHQDECIDKMFQTKKKVNICKLFCGTGKTLLFTTYLDEIQNDLVVIAFPRIDLLNQYTNDYTTSYKQYIISSDHESRSDTKGLLTFLKRKGPKMVLVTHTSFWKVLETIETVRTIDCVIVDEVHHFNSKKNIKDLGEIDATRVFGFTATPAKYHPDPIYSYSYADAKRDGRCKQFEIDLYNTDDVKTSENIYKGLVYLAEKTGVKNVLCFHAFSEIGGKNGKTSVSTYRDLKPSLKAGVTRFKKGLKSHVITGTMKSIERSKILTAVGKAPVDQLNIVHTCNTVSEGIDTKSIGSICFVDPKGSVIAIIQAIGRCTRLDGTDNPARIFILNFGDLDDYKTVLGVLNFLCQDNPELYEAAVKNPSHLMAVDYKFHFANVIFNEKGGEMYKGRYIDELAEDPTGGLDGIRGHPTGTAFVECSNSLEGELIIHKPIDINVDKWLYFYVDEETGEILDFLGEGVEPQAVSKPKKFIKVDGIIPKMVFDDVTIDDILDEIWDTSVLPTSFEKLKENRATLSEENDQILSGFFKTEDWDSVTPKLFQKYLLQIKDPKVLKIDYKWTRLDEIRELIETIKANNGEFPSANEEKGKLWSSIKSIKRGSNGSGNSSGPAVTPLSETEDRVLTEQFGNNWWLPSASTSGLQNGLEQKCKNLLLSYFNEQNPTGLQKLKILQSGKESVFPGIERMLYSIDPKWRNLQPTTLCDIYWNMDDGFHNDNHFDDTISIAPGGSISGRTTVSAGWTFSETQSLGYVGKPLKKFQNASVATIPEEHDVMVTIFDFEDAVSEGKPLDASLKAEVKKLYREKNEFLMKFLEDSGICGRKLLEFLR